MVAHYLNLEFDAPTVVYAEGVAAETYANHANRHMFENAAEYTALYGDDERVMIDAAGNNLRRFPIVFDGPRFQDARPRFLSRRRAWPGFRRRLSAAFNHPPHRARGVVKADPARHLGRQIDLAPFWMPGRAQKLLEA